ncbi:MAG: SpoIVB peptidase [Patescibacteria group bacterium]
MLRHRRRQVLLSAGLLVFLAFFVLTWAAVSAVPAEMHLLQGEIGRLRAAFPLSLKPTAQARPFLWGSAGRGTELVFRSAATGVCEVELSLLGALPLRRIAVAFLPERRIVVGGQAIGVLLATDGVVVVGHQPLRGLDGSRRYPAREAGLQIGDVIVRVDGSPVRHAADLADAADAAAAARRMLRVTVRRAGRNLTVDMDPVVCPWPPGTAGQKPRAMLGLFVEDPAAGVGTLTFYDPATRVFAALGHKISELGGQRPVWLEGGKIVAARISGIEQGQRGSPGEKIGTFSGPGDVIGTIERNSRFGLFGRLDEPPAARREMLAALAHQVRPGPASILTVVQGTEVEEFDVEILRVYPQSRPRDKGMVIKVVDPRLLSMTGGIVQGMSGSPVIQQGRLVGAVTHVFVNDPTRGYGVLAEWMLQELDTLARSGAA